MYYNIFKDPTRKIFIIVILNTSIMYKIICFKNYTLISNSLYIKAVSG
jgi:hypothetical protein